MSKIITIDEDLFRVNGRSGSRKKRDTTNKPDNIKIKSPVREKPKSLKRNHILKFIREQQENNYKRLVQGDPNIRHHANVYNDEFNTPFDNTLKYLMEMVDTNTDKSNIPASNHRQTIRNRSPHENVSMEMPSSFQNISPSIQPTIQNEPIQLSPPVRENAPKWGCLKNGNLPTFRSWQNHTQRIPPSSTTNDEPVTITPLAEVQKKRVDQAIQDELDANIPRLNYPKHRRVVRRTYKVGKSKSKPQIGVLVSNRTIRNRVTTESQLLKQVPIEDARRYLVKKGFIKVGSSCPNDVLRKMHETAKLMCGEMENHNTDNLLYNFFNNAESG